MTRDQKTVAAGAAAGIAAMALAMWLLSTFLPAPAGVEALADRLAYAARWLAFAALPLFAMVAAVGNARFASGAIDPTLTTDLDYSKAVACTGKAGTCSFHHVRLVHGSAQNTSERPRNLLLYECAAADAWPLVNFKDLDELNSRMLCGEPTLEPRLEKVPVRMPLPPALAQGSIYENQTVLRNRFFEVKAAT